MTHFLTFQLVLLGCLLVVLNVLNATLLNFGAVTYMRRLMALQFMTMDTEQLCWWLADQNLSGDVVANFRGTITLLYYISYSEMPTYQEIYE